MHFFCQTLGERGVKFALMIFKMFPVSSVIVKEVRNGRLAFTVLVLA